MKTKAFDTVPVIFAIDNNYAPMLHVTIQSIVAHANPAYQYRLHVLYENLDQKWQQSLQTLATDNCHIEFNFVGNAIQQYGKIMHYKFYGSNAIYYRVFIPELFPQYDKAIYLDADVVLNADIAELYSYDLGDNYVGGVPCEIVNYMPPFVDYALNYLGFEAAKMPCYFNSGVILMNCAKMRATKFIHQFFQLAERFKLELCPDQDYFNLLCYDQSVILPAIWNKMPLQGSQQTLSELKLVHFNVAGKPWKEQNALYQELFWEHAQNTPVYQQLLKMREDAVGQYFGAEKVRMLSEFAEPYSKQHKNLLQVLRQSQK